jgi:methyl-accepting chemotaxis protein
MAGDPKRRFLSMLRRTAKSAQSTMGARNAAEENALWSAHERALTSTKDGGASSQRLSSHVARQRGAIDAVADRARAAATRTQELAASMARVADAFDKLSLVALNAGLEGARLGESAGRALLLVADEVRTHAARGSETTREVTSSSGEIAGELSQFGTYVSQARDTTADVAQEAARVAGACSEVESALLDLGEKLRKSTGSDAETVRAIAEAGENARALVSSLSSLSGKVPKSLLLGALRPVLEPLARLLAEDDGDEETE